MSIPPIPFYLNPTVKHLYSQALRLEHLELFAEVNGMSFTRFCEISNVEIQRHKSEPGVTMDMALDEIEKRVKKEIGHEY